MDMVLATDMSQHKVHLTNFTNAWKNYTNQIKSSAGKKGELVKISESFKTTENVDYVKRMLIKCADVSNPARPLKSAVTWAERITEEFCRQTDEEIERNLPVTMPMYNRSTCSLPSTQIGFYDFVVTELYNIWHGKSNILFSNRL